MCADFSSGTMHRAISRVSEASEHCVSSICGDQSALIWPRSQPATVQDAVDGITTSCPTAGALHSYHQLTLSAGGQQKPHYMAHDRNDRRIGHTQPCDNLTAWITVARWCLTFSRPISDEFSRLQRRKLADMEIVQFFHSQRFWKGTDELISCYSGFIYFDTIYH